MKKIICGILAVIMMMSLMVGCASKPSENEVISAIKNGSLTLEDATEKGYVTKEWAEKYIAENSVAASDKFSANQIGEFTTKDTSDKDFTFTPSDKPVLFAFVDPEKPEGLAEIKKVVESYEEIKTAGGDAMIVIMGDKLPEELKDCPITSIFYTDDIKKQIGTSTDMVDGNAFSASWSMKGSFITSWYSTLEKAELSKTAKALLEAFAKSDTEAADSQGATIQGGQDIAIQGGQDIQGGDNGNGTTKQGSIKMGQSNGAPLQ